MELVALGEEAKNSGRGPKWSLAAQDKGTPPWTLGREGPEELSSPMAWTENWEV